MPLHAFDTEEEEERVEHDIETEEKPSTEVERGQEKVEDDLAQEIWIDTPWFVLRLENKIAINLFLAML